MKLEEARYNLRRLLRKFQSVKAFEISLIAAGLALLTYSAIGLLYHAIWLQVLLAVVAGVVIASLMVYKTKVLTWGELQLTYYLNRVHPQLQESSDLLVSAKPLMGLQIVQQQKLLECFGNVMGQVRVPLNFGQPLIVFLAGLISYVLLPIAAVSTNPIPIGIGASTGIDSVWITPEIEKISLTISPPPYTGIAEFSMQAHNLVAPMNSNLVWEVVFRGKVNDPQIIFGGLDSVALVGGWENTFAARKRFADNNFYQVTWRDERSILYQSQFYKIEIRKDQPPLAKVLDLPQFVQIGFGDPMRVSVLAELSDDYGITSSYIVATVSKGSGESVKFREEKLSFDNGVRFSGKRANASRVIDLMNLGLEGGDELYFYIEVRDNMVPTHNVSRTETFFIALQDSSVAAVVADTGLGVDLLPEYFRSQRQIIIDTEKLLAEQRKIKRTDFNARSNELGYDQKALRLRYGQFLGMEDEAGIGVEANVSLEEEDPLTKFGHQHDTKNEHNLVADKKAVVTEAPDHEKDEKNEDPLKAFLHEHDSEDEATFFDQSIKAKLKAALALMWDSELHLRLYEPKKSLPFQYRILTLLKEISQDSRVYVHRVGFDPPPIKEEKRLTGDQEEIVSTVGRMQVIPKDSYPAIVAAMGKIEEMLQQQDSAMDDNAKLLFNNAGYEVAVAELRRSGAYLLTLSTLRKLVDGRIAPADLHDTLLKVRKDFWNILPIEVDSPNRTRRTLHQLDRALLQIIETNARD